MHIRQFVHAGIERLRLSRLSLLVLLLALAALAGCKSENAKRCEAAVRHVLLTPFLGLEELEGQHRQIQDIIVKRTLEVCLREGISVEQADCILRVQTMDQLMELGDCPAILTAKPSWLIVSTRAQRQEIERQLAAERDAGM